jgi:hypothetical protein
MTNVSRTRQSIGRESLTTLFMILSGVGLDAIMTGESLYPGGSFEVKVESNNAGINGRFP